MLAISQPPSTVFDGEAARYAPVGVRCATCTIVGLPIVHGFVGHAASTAVYDEH